MKAGAKGPSKRLNTSRISLYGKDGRLRKVVDKEWKLVGTGLMHWRTDRYKMSSKITKDQQRVFERSKIKLGRGRRPYSHKISGIGKYGSIKGSETAHGVERKKIPKGVLGKAAAGRLAKSSPEYKRYFR